MAGTSELDHARAMMNGNGSGVDNNKEQTERVVKLFNDPEKIKAIKENKVVVQLGRPVRDYVIEPLSPRQMIKAYPLIRKLLVPIITTLRGAAQNKNPITIAMILEQLDEGIVGLGELLHLMIVRANPSLTVDEVLDNFDLIPDFITVWPFFAEQNLIDKLFLGKPQPPSATISNGGIEKTKSDEVENEAKTLDSSAQ